VTGGESEEPPPIGMVFGAS